MPASEIQRGKVVVVSGPSGVGKSTVVKEVLAKFAGRLRLSISATTRQPRPGERDGVDYHFLSDEAFSERRQAGDFVECIEVFGRGIWYGTLWSEVSPFLDQGIWVLLEIDVDGAEDVLPQFDEAVTIFIRPSSREELERRLRSRGTETEEAIQARLGVADRELEKSGLYQYQVQNDVVDQAVDAICHILQGEGLTHD